MKLKIKTNDRIYLISYYDLTTFFLVVISSIVYMEFIFFYVITKHVSPLTSPKVKVENIVYG